MACFAQMMIALKLQFSTGAGAHVTKSISDLQERLRAASTSFSSTTSTFFVEALQALRASARRC